MKKVILIVLAAFLVMGCRKSNIDEYQSYIGLWAATSNDNDYTLNVNDDGQATYNKLSTNSGTSTTYSGKFIKKGSTLKIGLKKFTINKEPALYNGKWRLTMDDIEYTKEF